MKKTLVAALMTASVVLTMHTAGITVMAEEQGGFSLSDLVSAFMQNEDVQNALSEDGEVLGEGGLISSLFGENGALSEYVPEGVDVEQLAKDAAGQLTDENSELYQGLDELSGLVTDENGSVDLEKVAGLAEMLLGSFGDDTDGETVGLEGETEFGDEGFGFITLSEEAQAAAKEYIIGFNEGLEESEYQVVNLCNVVTTIDENGDYIHLGFDTQMNYNADGTDLVMTGAVAQPILLRIAQAEDGTCTVTDAKAAEDGEGYADSVKALCEEAGTTTEEFDSTMEYNEMAVLGTLIEFMNDHPEFERIEKDGEMLTAEDLDAQLDAAVEVVMGGFFDSLMEELPEEMLTEADTEAVFGE